MPAGREVLAGGAMAPAGLALLFVAWARRRRAST
jgi:hypothetical protein